MMGELAGAPLTQDEVGVHVGLTDASVSAWENGATPPNIDVVEKIAALLRVTPEWLAWGRGERYASVEAPRPSDGLSGPTGGADRKMRTKPPAPGADATDVKPAKRKRR